jgi:hypothetical protein
MSTVQTTPRPVTSTRSPKALVFTGIAALVAVAATILVLALAGAGGRTQTTLSQHGAAYYPLIHYRGTGAPPAASASASTERCVFVRSDHRCIWVP